MMQPHHRVTRVWDTTHYYLKGRRHVRRKVERADQAYLGRHTLSRDVERCAVVNRRSYDGQAQSNIHAALEIKQLQRHVTLVVVHADDGVKFLLPRRSAVSIWTGSVALEQKQNSAGMEG